MKRLVAKPRVYWLENGVPYTRPAAEGGRPCLTWWYDLKTSSSTPCLDVQVVFA